jgi:hypothetical protein
MLISLILLSTPIVSVWADQTVVTTVSWNSDHTIARVTVIVNGVKKEYIFKTSPTGAPLVSFPPPQTLVSWNPKSRELRFGDGSYGGQVRVSKLPYPYVWGGADAIRIHLSATALLIADIVLIVAMIAVIASYYDYNVVRVLLAAFININSFILKDRNADWSLDLWVPYDWYNMARAACVLLGSKCPVYKSIYIGTVHYWWLISDNPIIIPRIVTSR